MLLLAYRLPIISSIRRPDNCVGMKFRRLSVGQKYARMVIELDYDHGTLYPVVERVVVSVRTNPAKVRLGEVLLDQVQL